MKKPSRIIRSNYIKFGVILFSLTLSHTVFADPEFITPDVPKIDAEAYILIDANSNQILAEENADKRWDPASLTKMMTSYVISESIQAGKIGYNDIVTIGKDAWATGNPVLAGSSLMFLKPGDKVSVDDLNKGIIIQSGNDACIAMAEYVAGSQDAFVSMMNSYAGRLGLTNTQFQTVHGLDAPEQYTSARDMAKLGQAIIKEHPEDYKIYSEKEFTFGIKQQNRNGLLWDTSLHVDGIKTGHTKQAGYNLVASAVDKDTRLISVVLGGKTFKGREAESKKLLTWGFRFFETIEIDKANTVMTEQRIWYGKRNTIKLGSNQDIIITIPRGQRDQLRINYVYNSKDLMAPIQKDQQVGSMQFIVGDKVVAEKPLLSLEDINKSGFFGSFFEFFKYKFHQWFG